MNIKFSKSHRKKTKGPDFMEQAVRTENASHDTLNFWPLSSFIFFSKKGELSKRWPRDMPWKISTVPEYAHGYFSENFSQVFVRTDPTNVRTKFEVYRFTCS